MLIKRPQRIAICGHLVFQSFVQAENKMTNEVVFFRQSCLSNKDLEFCDILLEGFSSLDVTFELRQGIGFLVWVTKRVEEALLELVKGIGLLFSGKAILPFPGRRSGAFDIREDECNVTCITSGGIGELDISIAFLDKFFAT